MTIDWKSWKDPLRDAAMIYVITLFGGFVEGFTGAMAGQESPSTSKAMSIVTFVLGFTIVGCSTKHERSKHLPVVALLVWLVNLSNVPLGFKTFPDWVQSILLFMLYMLIGGAFSYIFVRGTPSSLKP